MSDQIIEIIIPEENHLERIDKFLTDSLEYGFSRNYIQKLIKDNNIKVNDKEIKQNYKVKFNDNIKIDIPEPKELELSPQDISFKLLYEDDSIAVIDKPPGLVVHPGPGNWDNTLVNALLFHLNKLSSIGGVIRPGIVHRLDKDTCGLMVIAKCDNAHQFLSEDFANRKIIKKYSCIVTGKPAAEQGIIDKPIARHPKYRHKMTISENGRDAITEYRLKKIWNTKSGVFSFLEITLHTGRTHQIRVHLSSTGNPIVGDPVYSKKWARYKVPFLLLAATYLEFKHPESGQDMRFEIPLPLHIRDFMQKLDTI